MSMVASKPTASLLRWRRLVAGSTGSMIIVTVRVPMVSSSNGSIQLASTSRVGQD